MQRILVSIGIFAAILAFGSFYNFLTIKQRVDQAELVKLSVGSQVFEAEIADEPLEHSRGLSERTSLPENQGMLFIFPNAASRYFWMAGMKFPLDIIWIRDNEIIGFSENLPPASRTDYPFYSSPVPVDKVLEINAGLVEKLRIKAGDSVVIQ